MSAGCARRVARCYWLLLEAPVAKHGGLPRSRPMVLTNLSQTPLASSAADGRPAAPAIAPGDAPAATGTIPVYSSWFAFDKIHEIERRSLPEFFPPPPSVPAGETCRDKNAATYIEYRDFMVQTYCLRPHDYLSITTCRRHLTGDVGAIVRVHAFLEQWGLINYQAELPAGARRDRPVYVAPAQLDIPLAMAGAVQSAALDSLSISGAGERTASKDGKIFCAQCAVECPRLYYTHTAAGASASGSASLNLCGLCYAEGRYPSSLYSGDFVKIDVAAIEAGMRGAWGEEETLALLSAIEDFPDDWDSVAQKVGRPKDQCVLHFLRLPTVETIDQATIAHVGAGLARSVPLSGFPFSAADNPIMSTLAFLAAAVHPKVAAAAAQATIAETLKLRDASAMDTDAGPDQGEPCTPRGEDLANIAAATLACASARAHTFAEEEGRKTAALCDTLVGLQLQKLRVKMSIYEDLERSLDEDRKELEQQRLQLFFDRFNLRKQMIAIEQKSGICLDGTAPPSERVELVDGADGGAGDSERTAPKNVTIL